MVPPDAPIGADVAYLEAVRVLERWPFVGHLPGGGFIAGGRWAHVKRLVRPLEIELLTEALKLELLSMPSAGGRASGCRLQGAMPAFMAAVLLGFAGLDALGEDTQEDPLGGELGEPAQGVGGKGHTVVGADALGQTVLFEQAGEYWLGLGHTGRREGLTAEEKAAVAIGHGERITIEPVARFEVALEIGAPDIVGGQDLAGGLPRMANVSTVSCLGHQAMAAEDIANRGARGYRPARMTFLEN
jgi:hypothetical protein